MDTAVWCRYTSEYCDRCDPRHWTRSCHVLAKWHFSGALPWAVAWGVLRHKFHAATFWLSLVLTGRATINCQTRRFTEPRIMKYSVASVAKFRFQFKDHQSGHHATKALMTSFFPAVALSLKNLRHALFWTLFAVFRNPRAQCSLIYISGSTNSPWCCRSQFLVQACFHSGCVSLHVHSHCIHLHNRNQHCYADCYIRWRPYWQPQKFARWP